MKNSSYLRKALILGLLSAVGPSAIDMYLPAMPSIAENLHTTVAAVQMTLMSYFFGFGTAQLFYGPISDMLGRKTPLYFGLAVFTFGALGCALAPSVGWLIACRCIQGIGGAAMITIPRAVIRDMHTGIEATRLLSLVMLVFSVSPILAPLVGSTLIIPFGWRSVFIALTAVAAVGLFLTIFLLPETHPRHRRLKGELKTVRRGYGTLLRSGRFIGLILIGGLGLASFFAFLSSSSFLYIEHFGLTPREFGLAFSLNAVGFIGASQFSATLGKKFGMERVVVTAVSVYAVFALILLALTLAGADSLIVLMALLFCAFAWLGLVMPTSFVLALDDQGEIAGMASALGGTLQMLVGGLTVAIVSRIFNGTALPMVAAIALCAAGAFGLAQVTLRRKAWATAGE